MSDFTEINVDGSGDNTRVFGDYRMNRHRIYFCKPTGSRPYIAQLLKNFDTYFNQESADVEIPSIKHNGMQTFQFSGKISLSDISDKFDKTGDVTMGAHDDWVCVVNQDKTSGFTAQTLKRNFLTTSEKRWRVGSRVSTPFNPLDDMMVDHAISVNQYHFLAGRRSWMIGPACDFDHDNVPANVEDLMVFETSAIERISRIEYQPGAGLFDDQTKIIWASLLRTYVRKMGLERVDHRPWLGGEQKDGVSFVYKHLASKNDMVKASRRMCQLHKHLWPAGAGS